MFECEPLHIFHASKRSLSSSLLLHAPLLPSALRKRDDDAAKQDNDNDEGERLQRTQPLKIFGIPAIEEFKHALVSREP
jgi:hypothetical protein